MTPETPADRDHWRVALAEFERRRRRRDRDRAQLAAARDYGLAARHSTKAARVGARAKGQSR